MLIVKNDLLPTMKSSAMFVWVFINLLCFGMCGYVYLIWTQFWMSKDHESGKTWVKNLRSEYNKETTPDYSQYVRESYASNDVNIGNRGHKNRRSAVGMIKNNDNHKSTPNPFPIHRVVAAGGPRFPNVHDSILETNSIKYSCDNIKSKGCIEKTELFKNIILKEFRRVVMDESNVFKSGVESQNYYQVRHNGRGKEMSRREIMCSLSKVHLRTVEHNDQPFYSEGFRIPKLKHDLYDTCAVVTSAGALLESHLGSFIDSHQMVLRFNNAPVINYSDDVGSKTTLRVLNSQVVSLPQYNFLEDRLYRNVTVLIWDPAKHSDKLADWYRHPDFPLFPVYKRFLEEVNGADAHLIQPEVLWDLWKVLQDASSHRLRKNPPSSGFIGLWFALHRCKLVRMFEFVPSSRVSRRCHYMSPVTDLGCTVGTWHPLAQEKLIAEQIRTNSDIQVFQQGYIEIPGFSTIEC